MTRNLSRLITAIAAVLLAHGAVGQTTPSYRNSIVAEVNDKIITRQMVMVAMKPEDTLLRRQYARQPQLYGQKYTQLQAELGRAPCRERV